MPQTAHTVRIHLFGRPHLIADGAPVKFKAPPRALSLLAYLLVNDGAPLMRDAVAFALWPDDIEVDARANLRRHLFYLTNDVLPPPAPNVPWILADKRTIAWNNAASAWADVREFTRLSAISGADAAALYRGDLLDGFDDEWVQAPRERLRERQVAMLLDLIERSRAADDLRGGIAYARRALEIDPWREDAIRALIALRSAAGDRAGALATYRDFIKRLDAEMGVPPMPETTAAYQRVAAVLDSSAAPVDNAASANEGANNEPGSPAPDAIANGEAVRAVSSFTGRESELAQIESALWQHRGVVAVHGLGGVGKSALAREYSRRLRERYAAVWWLHASSEDGIIDGLLRLGTALTPAIAKMNDRRVAAEFVIANVLRDLTKPVLLIFDNLDDERLLRSWLPGPTAHVLVTARRALSGGAIVPIRLQGWETGESVRYLEREISRADISANDAARLAAMLGFLPLALAHAAAYLKNTANVTIDRYLERIHEHLEKTPRGADYDGAVLATFREAVVQAEHEAPGAAALLSFAACFSPDAIPDELFAQPPTAYAGLAPALVMTPAPRELRTTVQSAADLDDALGALNRFTLLDFSAQTRTFAVHRLVQTAARSMLVSDAPAWAQSAVVVAEAAFPIRSDYGQWLRCARLVVHARVALDALDLAVSNYEICAAAARLALRCGKYLRKRADFEGAEALLRRGLSLAQTGSTASDDLTVAEHTAALGVLLRDTNRLADAQPLLRGSVAIFEAHLGGHHPRLAAALSDLAILLQFDNRPIEAEALFRRALEIDSAGLGPAHPTVTMRRYNLALILHESSRLDEAEALLRDALSVDVRTQGDEHPDVASDLISLGWLLYERGRIEEAEPLLRQAVALRQKVHGTSHPALAHALNDLAVLLHESSRQIEAEQTYRQALTIYETTYGPHHPVVAACLNDIAQSAADAGRFAEGEALYRRALHSDELTYGASHVNVARDLNNLAGLLSQTQRPTDAAELMRRASAIVVDANPAVDRRAWVIRANTARLVEQTTQWQQIHRSPSRGFR